MLNFIRGKIQRWGSKQRREELQYFVEMLKGADLNGRAMTVAFAIDFRNKVMYSKEFIDARLNGFAPLLLIKTYQKLQNAGMLPNAAGVAIWLNTERAMEDLTLMPTAREMWALLGEAFPFVEQVADDFRLLGGPQLDLAGFENIPVGFEQLSGLFEDDKG